CVVYPLFLHDALPIYSVACFLVGPGDGLAGESGFLPQAECWGGMQGACCLRSTLAVCPMGWTPLPAPASYVPKWAYHQPLEPSEASIMKITTLGIDLAKQVFQLHGVDEQGKTVLRKQLKRDQMATFFATLPVCLIGMEACGSAHHWARKLESFGHTVRLIAPQFVKPYVKTNKNDAAD